MDLRIFTEPQLGAAHASLVALARAAREHGFDGFFRSDHVLTMGAADGRPGPSESFVSLGAIAAQVPDIRLGTLVSSATFRHPGMLAIAAATVDDISGGRLELGLGSGWYEAEHLAYGLPFGASFSERFDRLTEQLEILTGLWETTTTFDHDGRHYRLQGAPGLPKSVQHRDGVPHIPLILGGRGPKRTPALAARFADEFNVGFASVEEIRAQIDRVRAACEGIGRDPAGLVYSTAQQTLVGSGSALRRRAVASGVSPDALSGRDMTGSVEQLLERLGQYASVGVQRVYLQLIDVTDLDQVAELAALVRPARSL